MFESESDGTAKGGLKNRLQVLTVLLKISKKHKFNLRFQNINEKRIEKINKISMFFYTPAKIVLDDKTSVNNVILYDKSNEINKTSCFKNNDYIETDLEIIKKSRKKRGIGLLDKLEEKESNENSIKDEIVQKYNVSLDNVSSSLENDYIMLKDHSQDLFDVELNEEVKEELILDRIKAEKKLLVLEDIIEKEEDKDYILNKDILYDLSVDNKSYEKLKKMLEEQQKELENLVRNLDEFNIITERKIRFTNLGTLIDSTIGIGIGLLTLPFSFSRSFALGSQLIHNSISNINKKVKLNVSASEKKAYRITIKDIETSTKSLKSSDYLLESTLDQLEHLKHKIKYYSYKIPDVDKKLEKIEILENGLIKKKRELNKLVEKLEKSKTKVIKRSGIKK